MAFNFTGGGTYRLESSIGSSDTSFTLSSFLEPISGTPYTMTYLATDILYGTLDPQVPTRTEFISFTGITQNADGTATLTGVVRGLSRSSPYTGSATYESPHSGQSIFILSNTPQFYEEFVSKRDNQTISGLITFTQSPIGINPGGQPNASTTVQGVVQLPTQAQVDAKTATGSTGAKLTPTPDLFRSTLLSDYVVDTGAADAYVITPLPVISAYATGQIFTFKAIHSNTTASTLNVNGKGAIAIKKNGTLALVAGDILLGQIIQVEYDGTNFQLINTVANPQLSQSGKEIYAADSVGTDSYAVTLVPAISAYLNGFVVNFKAGTANTGAATLAVNGLSAITIKKNFNQTLANNDIALGQIVTVVYDGTNFQMQSQIANTNTNTTNGVATLTINSGTPSSIAHGLGRIPVEVDIVVGLSSGAVNGEIHRLSFGSFDASGQSVYYIGQNAAASSTANTDASNAVAWQNVSNTVIKGAITVDATNITITWTGSDGTSAFAHWKVR